MVVKWNAGILRLIRKKAELIVVVIECSIIQNKNGLHFFIAYNSFSFKTILKSVNFFEFAINIYFVTHSYC